jgi:hypothetical protein
MIQSTVVAIRQFFIPAQIRKGHALMIIQGKRGKLIEPSNRFLIHQRVAMENHTK